ncbi:MAG: class I SAM-dependent methyltransferase [Chloroflexaceae bacterium]|nr:class I SAM-dependent methyltransferase [Chloroflexaceae bacterium]
MIRKMLPTPMKKILRRVRALWMPRRRVSRERRESNRWLAQHTPAISGRVLSIGSGDDYDREGKRYRDYFPNCSAYITSEVTMGFGTSMLADIRCMPFAKGSIDCIFCSGVLEHVDDWQSGLREMTYLLKQGGILLLGLPFRQPIHMAPYDYWRFTEYGIRYMLQQDYDILDLANINVNQQNFPATYWVKASKR